VGLNNSFGDLLLNFVLGTMFLVLPALWITALGWAGAHAGAIAQNIAAGAKDAGNMGGKGPGIVSSKLK